MAGKAMDVYLNDHLAGSMMGTDLAEQIAEMAEGTPLGAVMTSLSAEIEQDRQVLSDLMDALGTSKNPIKQATGWLAEKASRPKFSGFTAGEPEHGTFMALESLALGVHGKLSLWVALKEVRERYQPLAAIDLDNLIARAEKQHALLERERLSGAQRAFEGDSVE